MRSAHHLSFGVALALALLALLVAGCGSSADGKGEEAAVSKAQFMDKAEAICKKADKTQNAAIRAFRKRFPKADSSAAWQERIVVAAGLPPIQIEAEELGDLAVPSGDEEEVKAIVEGMEEAVEKARANPGSMLEKGSVGPFTEVFKLAEEYGFEACATPI